eukprot:3223084-Prymnesium_polylepis.2
MKSYLTGSPELQLALNDELVIAGSGVKVRNVVRTTHCTTGDSVEDVERPRSHQLSMPSPHRRRRAGAGASGVARES